MLLIDLLSSQSIFLLFFVAVLGHLIGKISIKGVRLDVSAVLFVGLALSALNANLILPPIITSLGLIIFVFSIGIASGPGFFASLKRNGLRNNLLVATFLIVAAGAIILICRLLHSQSAIIAGLFTGALTNTPALAGAVEVLTENKSQLANLPAVGYAIAYPMGVLGPILAIVFWQRHFKINYEIDTERATDAVAAGKKLHNKTVQIDNTQLIGRSLRSVERDNQWPVVFGRIQHGSTEWLAATSDYIITKGDYLNIIGAPEDVDKVVAALGKESNNHINLDMSQHPHRRIVISSKQAAGRKIRDLKIPEQFGAIITRVKRGDTDMLANKDLVLEYGDQVLVITNKSNIKNVRNFLGDSLRETSSINIMAIGISICLGLAIGSIPFDLPGGITFKLGEAGGPLLVGLVLGTIHRSGRIIWGLPYVANLTLRELGLILMLAGIGTRSGQTFISAIQGSNGPILLATAAAVSLAVPFIFLPLAYKKFKMPFAMAAGMMAAIHTQPAVHAYAVQQARNDLPNYGYAMAFPTATILKIIIAQLIVIALAT